MVPVEIEFLKDEVRKTLTDNLNSRDRFLNHMFCLNLQLIPLHNNVQCLHLRQHGHQPNYPFCLMNDNLKFLPLQWHHQILIMIDLVSHAYNTVTSPETARIGTVRRYIGKPISK